MAARVAVTLRASGTAFLQPLFWLAVGVSTLTAAYAVLSARGLVYDGSFYLLAIASTRSFHFFEPARLSAQALQQLPAVLGARFGIHNLWILAKLFSLGMSGWPVVLTAICWFVLPRQQKSWIVGPLINLVFAIPAANFIGINEGVIASCLLWLALLLVMFRLAQTAGALASLLASLACAITHEAAIFCLLVIAWLAAAQMKDLKSFCRIAALLVVIVSVAGALYMAKWIVFPRSAIERGDFLLGALGGFAGSPTAPNMAALASLLAGLSIVAALALRRRSTIAATAGVVAVLACAFAFAIAPAALVSPSRIFAARGLPVIVTTVLAAVFAFLRGRGATPTQFITRSAIAVVLALALSQGLMQVVETNLWRDYLSDLRVMVASKHGAISNAAAMEALDPGGARFRRELLESWSVEPLSVLLAPDGRIVSVVEPAPRARWVPYRLNEPQTLPRMPQLDWSHFAARPET